MSMNMSNGSGVARMISSVTNADQGGGERKSGQYSTVGRRYSSYGPEQQANFLDMTNPKVSMVTPARPMGTKPVPAQKIIL